MVNAIPSGLAISPRAIANLKRSLILALPCGGLSLLALALVGHPLAGLFVVVGLALGALNTWLVQWSVARYGDNRRKRRLVGSTVGRLAMLTVASLLAIYFIRPDGAGLLAGIAIFQVIVLVGAAVAVLREMRR